MDTMLGLTTLTTLLAALCLLPPCLGEEWHASDEILTAANDRRSKSKEIISAVWDKQKQSIWILQADCVSRPEEPEVLQVAMGQNQHSLSHVVTWSPSWPKLHQCGHWRFPAHFDDVTESMVFFGGLNGRNPYKNSPGTRRRYSTFVAVNFSNQVWALSTRPGNYSWTMVPALGPKPPARSRHGAAWDPQGHRMWIFGGAGGDAGDYNERSVPGFNDLWQGQFNKDNSISWTMLGAFPKVRASDNFADPQLVWDSQRSAVWTLFRPQRLELWCYLTQQRYWRDFSLGNLENDYPPAALVWHGKAQEILLLNGTESWIFNPSTSAFQAPTVIAATYLPYFLSDGRYVWDEARQEAIFVGFNSNGRPTMSKVRLHASCSNIFCPSGYMKNLESQGHSVAECCGQPCSSFLCPMGFEQIHDAAWLVGDTQELCCRTEGSQPKFVDRNDGSDDQAGTESKGSGPSENTFLWVAIGAIGLLLLVVLINFYLLRKKCSFRRSSRTAGQDMSVDSSA